MLRERVISALVGVPVIVLFLLLGRYFFAFLVAAIVVISIDELYSMFLLRDLKPNVIIGVAGGIAIVAGALLGSATGLVLALSLAVIVTLVWQILTQGSVVNTGLTFIGLVYIAFSLSHMVLQYDLNDGRIGVLLVFVGTWASDIAAYSIGRAIGKRKLAPTISANKTVEGGIAGLVTPAIVLGGLFLLPWLPFVAKQGIPLTLIEGIGMGLVIGFAAPIGDLVESRIKREMRVKDTGTIIPGHGGFLDRFDSVIFTAIVGYYFWLVIT